MYFAPWVKWIHQIYWNGFRKYISCDRNCKKVELYALKGIRTISISEQPLLSFFSLQHTVRWGLLNECFQKCKYLQPRPKYVNVVFRLDFFPQNAVIVLTPNKTAYSFWRMHPQIGERRNPCSCSIGDHSFYLQEILMFPHSHNLWTFNTPFGSVESKSFSLEVVVHPRATSFSVILFSNK